MGGGKRTIPFSLFNIFGSGFIHGETSGQLSHTRDGCPLCLTLGETFISKTFPVCVGYRGIQKPAPAPLTPRGLPLFLGSPLSPIPRPHNVSGSFMQTGWFPTREKYSLNGQSLLLEPLKSPHTAERSDSQRHCLQLESRHPEG